MNTEDSHSNKLQEVNRKQHISQIRQSLKGFALISKNKTMVEKKLHTLWDSHSESDGQSFTMDSEDGILRSTFEHTELFAEKYETVGKLGEGSDGVVHRCIKKKTGNQYAGKTLMFDDQHVPLLRYNYMLMKGLSHRNIIKYQALYLDLKKHSCWLVMQLFQAPSLLRTTMGSQSELKWIVSQLLQTLHYLHQRSLTHRDVKPQNILYDRENKMLKLIDFGICRKYKRRGIRMDMLTITGTLYYRAPEMFSGGGYNQKVDIWAAGVTIYKLITGRTPFESQYHRKTIQNILTQEVLFPQEFDTYSPVLKALVNRMLKKDPKERPSALQCLKDFWLLAECSTNVPIQIHFLDEPNQEELQGYKSPIFEMEENSYIRKINGDEYHCFDSDDDSPRRVGWKRHSKSLVAEFNSFKL